MDRFDWKVEMALWKELAMAGLHFKHGIASGAIDACSRTEWDLVMFLRVCTCTRYDLMICTY